MNNYKKFAAKFCGVELLIIALANIVYYVTANNQEPCISRVQDKTGTIYRIIYTQTDDRTWILMDIALGILFLLSVFLICYIGKKIIKPFEQMQSLTEDLAKGNLSVPVKAEKSKFLGRFLWGMDMLRETLESNKEKELALQKEKKTLILSLTHDIRTPLSAIRLYAKALAENLYTTGERRVEACQGIEKNVKEIEEYVNEITLASREDFLQLSVNPGEVYLSHVIDAIRGLYEEKLHNLHTGFQIASYTDLLLKGDADRLIEVLQNLLENAIKYGDGKCISIDFSEEEDCRLITVRNSGCSLKQEELINLFDSFYRGSNVGSADGSGLGLYISRQLMQKMDGEVFAEIVRIRKSTKSHVSSSLKKLENKGLIKRKQSKDNKKHIEIVLLDDAALIVDAGLNAQKQFAQNVLRGLTEEEKHVCMNVFDKICNNAEELLRGESK